MRAVIAIGVAGLAAGCYEPTFEPCTISCGASGDCPGGLACVDGLCALEGTGACVLGDGLATLTGGERHACAAYGAELRCWGDSGAGQVAPGLVQRTNANAVQVPNGGSVTGWRSVSAGSAHTCAIIDPTLGDAEIVCWGDNSAGQLGQHALEMFATPTRPAGLRWHAVASGGAHTCAIAVDDVTAERSIWCWGDNSAGQLGIAAGVAEPEPVRANLPTDQPWHAIDAGAQHTCAVTRRAELFCWGDNSRGQLGTTAADGRVEGRWKAVATARQHTCGVAADTTVSCWGDNPGNRLGSTADVPMVERPEPVADLGADPGWTAIDTGARGVCGIKDGETYCWGDAAPLAGRGSLLVPQLTPRSPVIDLPVGATAVVASAAGACARDGDTVACWGDSPYGELGDGHTTIAFEPRLVANPTASGGYRKVVAGVDHTCAVLDDPGLGFSVNCWGRDDAGQAWGVAGDTEVRAAPGTPLGATNPVFIQVALGDLHTCYAIQVEDDTDVMCVGDDSRSQLASPSVRTGAVTQLTANRFFTCVVGDLQRVPRCWGTPGEGVPPELIPVDVSGTDFVATTFHLSGEAACGADASAAGVLKCFGVETAGELGNGTAGATYPTPVVAMGAPTAIVSDGVGRTRCASGDQVGTVECWGDNRAGQAVPTLQSIAVDLPLPVDVGPRAIVQLSSGFTFTCGRTPPMDGAAIWCWGNGEEGQRTSSTVGRAPTRIAEVVGHDPVQPPTNWSDVSAGGTYACGITPGGELYCWGYGPLGQLGLGELFTARATAGPIVFE